MMIPLVQGRLKTLNDGLCDIHEEKGKTPEAIV